MTDRKRTVIVVASVASLCLGMALLALAVLNTVRLASAGNIATLYGPPTPAFGQSSPLDPVSTFIASLIPTPLPPPPATPQSMPTPITAASFPTATGPGSTPNIAWGAVTQDSITIWVGDYSDAPSPRIAGARPVVQWNVPPGLHVKLANMALSPDHRSLAVLVASMWWVPGDTIGDAGWLSVVDLGSNKVQPIPDYSHQELYIEYSYASPVHIIGWVDNDRLAIESTGIVKIATKDGASSVTMRDTGRAVYSALSPDRKALFTAINDGDNAFNIQAVDGSRDSVVQNTTNTRLLDYPRWSPDGKQIMLLSENNAVHITVRLLDPSTGAQQAVSKTDAWDVAPAWSADSSSIAFLRADGPVSDYAAYLSPESVNSNIYITTLNDLAPKQVSNFTSLKNSDLQWTPAGNLLLSSTAGRIDDSPVLVAVSPNDGAVTTLATGSSGEALVCPVIFNTQK